MNNDFLARMNALKKNLDNVKSQVEPEEAEFMHLFSDIRRGTGKYSSCVQDFHTSHNHHLENEIIQKLSQPMALKKGKKSDYTDDRIEGKIVHDLVFGQDKGPPPIVTKKATKMLTSEKSNSKTSKNKSILTDGSSNTKTDKNSKVEAGAYSSMIFHLAPANLAGRGNVCPGLSAGCKKSCLNTAGRGAMITPDKPVNTIHEARIRRTQELFDNPHHTMMKLHKEIENLKKRASKNGQKPVMRLNGTSDLAWEKFRHPEWGGKNIFEMHPEVQFHDYTKRPERLRKNKHDNYHLTFSLAEDNHEEARKLLDEGHNVAAVFGYDKNKFSAKEYENKYRMPNNHWGFDVIDGDTHDLRFLDPQNHKSKGKKGVIVGLRAKEDAIYDNTGFVQWGHEAAPHSKPKKLDGKKSRDEILTTGLKDKKAKDAVEKLVASEAAKSKETEVKSLLKSLLTKITK